MKKLFFIWIFISSITAMGQSLSLQINDVDNNPVMGANISIEPIHKGDISDENGKAVFDLQPGSYTVSVSFVGYQTNTQKIELNEDLNLTITLNDDIFSINEVVISTPFNLLQSENVMKVDQATAAMMKSEGSFDLVDGMAKIPGLSQRSSGYSLAKPVVRGLTGNRVVVYTQGVRLENFQYGDDHSLGINSSGIESVEVIKGPASLLYGSDALAGVIYLNPEKFAAKGKSKAELSQGFNSATLGSNTSLMYAQTGEKFGFMLRGTNNMHQDYLLPHEEGYLDNSRFIEQDIKAGLYLEGEKSQTEVRYNFNKTKSGIIHAEEHEDHAEEDPNADHSEEEEHGHGEEFFTGERESSYTPEKPYQDVDMHIASLHHHRQFEKGELIANIGYSLNKRREIEEEHAHEEETAEPVEEEHHEEHEEFHGIWMNLSTLSYQFQYNTKNDSPWKLSYAVQGMFQENHNEGEETLIPDGTTNDIGAFAMAYYNKNSNSFQMGLRFDNRTIQSTDIDNSYNAINASLGYKRDLGSSQLRLNVASGFRAPSLSELTSDGVHHGSNRYEIGNPNLNAEQNVQFDLAYDLKSKHTEFYLNGFFNYINDYIYIDPTAQEIDGYQVFNYTQAISMLYGGETGIHIHPHPIDWLHVESDYQIVFGELSSGGYLPLIPPGQWTNQIRTSWNGEKIKNYFFSLVYEYNFAQDKVATYETTTPAYGLLNFNSGMNFGSGKWNFDLGFNVTNILNTEYIPHLSRLKPFEIPNPGRSFMLSLSAKI